MAGALLGYYFWPDAAGPRVAPAAEAGPASTPAQASPRAASTTPGGPALVGPDGARILNEAGLPPGPPLPQARPIPIRAAPGEVIGYSVDAQGNTKPLRAGELTAVPNSPGTYAVVDIFADEGNVVVPAPKPGPGLSGAELERRRERERERGRAIYENQPPAAPAGQR